MDIIKKLAEELNIGRHQAEAAVKLIDEGNTIPFIARYRKEATGSLNDEVLRNLDERLKYLRNLEDRKSQVIASIAEQEKLTPELELKIKEAQTLVAVEDLYRPYKPKRRTRAMIAKEKGLEPLADLISMQMTAEPVEKAAAGFVSEEKGVASVQEAIHFKAAFVNTLVYAIGTVPLTLACSLGLAMLLNQKVKFRNFFRTVSFFPYVASLVAVAAVWNMIFSPSMGPVNQILATLGVENLPKWAAGKDTAMLTVILFSVWKNMGYYMVIYLAGLQGTNPELEEAAELDGASKWQIFWNVTLPQLKPTTFFVIIMLTIASFKVYDQMYMITQGGPGNATMTLVYYIYNVAFVNTPKYGYASAVSMVLFVLVLFVTIIQFKGSSSND